eukprot:TRINITY_DN74817_c0_g1_i1.p1 TRINITY_DN74817_c0_g1~~TRINITY_DN74817_c0_g1_i1.p1  ORF type:complete len:368 (+),score=39.95 TRINITY_DN74817_c0_g1_i1:66-1169(+)
MLVRLLTACLFAFAVPLLHAYDYGDDGYQAEESHPVPAAAREGSSSVCPLYHVHTADGLCHLAWNVRGDIAVKPVDGVHHLGRVDAEFVRRLKVLAETIPEDDWAEPPSKFVQDGEVPIKYDQAVFHFPIHKGQFKSPYYIFPLAKEVHSWIEPFLLNITRRYTYAGSFNEGSGYLRLNFPRLFFARLFPGDRQMAHVDRGKSSLRPHKIHVPISGEDGALLHVCGNHGCIGHKFDTGFAYEVNNQVNHWAANDGTIPRINLLFEYDPMGLDSERYSGGRPVSLSEATEYTWTKLVHGNLDAFDERTRMRVREIGTVPASDDRPAQEKYYALRDGLLNELIDARLIPTLQATREQLEERRKKGTEEL